MEFQEIKVEELLINCVEARPPLWDCRLPLIQRSKTIRDELWYEIFQEFGGMYTLVFQYQSEAKSLLPSPQSLYSLSSLFISEQPQFSVQFLMSKWRNLRDTYVRVKGEYESYKKSGSAAKKKKIWEYYECMSFLRDTLSHRT